MKVQIFLSIAATLLSVSVGNARGTTLINFETLPNGDTIPGESEITNQYASLGVLFSSVPIPGAQQLTTVVNYVSTVSGFNSLGPNGPAPDIGGTLVLRFLSPVYNVGSYVIDDQAPVRITAYDSGNNVVGITSSDASQAGFDFWSLSYAGGISRVEMSGGLLPGFYDGWGIDDLSFTSAVPEPSALGLLSFGLAALVVRRSRQTGCRA